MKITKNLIEDIAKNARLKLSDREIKDFIPQVEEILKSFSILDKVNTNKVEPSFQPIKVKDVFREDEIKECLTQKEVLSNTKHKLDGYFKGPKVM